MVAQVTRVNRTFGGSDAEHANAQQRRSNAQQSSTQTQQASTAIGRSTGVSVSRELAETIGQMEQLFQDVPYYTPEMRSRIFDALLERCITMIEYASSPRSLQQLAAAVSILDDRKLLHEGSATSREEHILINGMSPRDLVMNRLDSMRGIIEGRATTLVHREQPEQRTAEAEAGAEVQISATASTTMDENDASR